MAFDMSAQYVWMVSGIYSMWNEGTIHLKRAEATTEVNFAATNKEKKEGR